jgi:hypothetical protein
LSVSAGVPSIKRRGQTCGGSPISHPSREQGHADDGYCDRASVRPTGDHIAIKALLSEIAERKSNLSVFFVAVSDQPQGTRDAAITTPS